jgi:hypothetical protein
MPRYFDIVSLISERDAEDFSTTLYVSGIENEKCRRTDDRPPATCETRCLSMPFRYVHSKKKSMRVNICVGQTDEGSTVRREIMKCPPIDPEAQATFRPS